MVQLHSAKKIGESLYTWYLMKKKAKMAAMTKEAKLAAMKKKAKMVAMTKEAKMAAMTKESKMAAIFPYTPLYISSDLI